MAGTQRVGLWFGAGLESALAARAVLNELQAERPGAGWVLFGPRSSLFLFEMDDRVAVYIPLRALEPRRSAQSRLSYFLEKRAQFKKLRGLQLNECFGVSLLSGGSTSQSSNYQKIEHTQFKHVQRMLGVGGRFIERELSVFLAAERPLLEAGPQALAFATQYHRKINPAHLKVLVLYNAAEGDLEFSANTQLDVQTIPFPNQQASVLVAVITNGDRLLARQLVQKHPDWLQVDYAQAMGLIAYADRVISNSEVVTRICQEMGRQDRILLGKSNSEIGAQAGVAPPSAI
ncbi:hypothetical protein [Limnobacter parvus]|uniref:Uncharacterized protein n=1 Tax=Limnobacter parvus TaxID=2939690 RepID=A0ABT1XI93_9BURK|nr:hypothetical protein [Limnobacter parvus]MCR2745789.1 hypothetical protein [Limnobacter parvus]